MNLASNLSYCQSLTNYKRRKTRTVLIGDIPLGSNFPVRVQSMTNTKTLDTEATVNQTIRLINAGSEYVRITAPGIKDAENLANIKEQLIKRGYNIPLIADIHFNPKAAEIAAKYVEKVRINPGNFVDKKKFEHIIYSDKTYDEEVDKIREKLVPLLNICKKHKTALRIGTNHGSLSDRIMSRYGDTPLGMVESAMEFLRICGEENFHQIVLSMKASNTRIMIQAYRLLIQKMDAEKMDYPLHLGVTEAGEGEDGRIKSAVGIGTLMADGIGDTIRVSLTEEPVEEIPVAKKIVHFFEENISRNKLPEIKENFYNPFMFNKRKSTISVIANPHQYPAVIISAKKNVKESYELLKPDYIFSESINTIKKLTKIKTGNAVYPFLTSADYTYNCKIDKKLFIAVKYNDLTNELLQNISFCKNAILVFMPNENFVSEGRLFFNLLNKNNIENPVILYNSYHFADFEAIQLKSAMDFGTLLSDGFGDGIWIDCQKFKNSSSILSLSFGILQACRLRVSKTEYISCPSCGRTLFNLQNTTREIREKTAHLKGLKIGIMGCIVNGPGEMADADYGYVGAGPGNISLYKGQEIIKKNVPANKAVDELINLIKEYGDWKEKE
ncbi:MAG: (E)-4-hydroxy-3-methylbut-2-enyl-diphosphate synthase [Chlorobi bacterium]|nr:(E)-4-hydroxy-3-methylbut-2-enyl-diphosphate synthase [Chlorobiota bacterium]